MNDKIYMIDMLTQDGAHYRREVYGQKRLRRMLDAFSGKVIDCEVSVMLTEREIDQIRENHDEQAPVQA